jgi:isochorismate pyruvate lyase
MKAQTSSRYVEKPTDCQTMADVRAGVDKVDAELIALIARRFAYMDAAARIKDDRDAVRDDARKAQVIANVRRAAFDYRIPQDVVETMWETLVEGSIAYEYDRWDALRR